MPVSQASTTDLVSVVASNTTTSTVANTTTTPVAINGIRIGVQFVLDATNVGGNGSDTYDVKVQALIEGTPANGTWTDAIHFTQLVGGGGAKREIFKLVGSTAVSHYDATGSLASGTQKDVLGDFWRASYTIVDGGDHAQSLTYSITALPF